MRVDAETPPDDCSSLLCVLWWTQFKEATQLIDRVKGLRASVDLEDRARTPLCRADGARVERQPVDLVLEHAWLGFGFGFVLGFEFGFEFGFGFVLGFEFGFEFGFGFGLGFLNTPVRQPCISGDTHT